MTKGTKETSRDKVLQIRSKEIRAALAKDFHVLQGGSEAAAWEAAGDLVELVYAY